jgi:hypothetical protein
MAFSHLPRATLRSISSNSVSRAVPPALALTLAVLAALVPRPALADDRSSIDLGRVAARGILIVRDPRACGIALLRERCIADTDAFLHGRGDGDFTHVPQIGPHPATGLRAFVTNGDRDGYDRALSWINNVQAEETRWKADARAAALYDAGILDGFFAAATGEMLAALPAVDLARHAASIPANALPLDVAPLRAMSAEASSARPNIYRMPQLVPFTKALVAAVAANAPQPPLATVPRGDTPAADAALGVAFATMAELIDSPQWAAQGDAQAFASALAGRLDALVPAAGRADVAAFRASVRAGASFDHDRANAALTAATSAFERAVPRERAQRFALAAAAAQLAYNAAILRSPENSAGILRVLAASAPLDAAIPGWAAARGGATSIGASDWLAQHAYALRLVDLIQKANPA